MSEIKVEVIADSLNIATGDRLTTWLVHIPKYILAELNTHRALSRNAGSSRAIPCKKIRKFATYTPVFQKNCKGMSHEEYLKFIPDMFANIVYWYAKKTALFCHWLLEKIGVHKQQANRIIEPYLFVDVVISATEINNFFRLRISPEADVNIFELALLMRQTREKSVPNYLSPGEWHIPRFPGVEYTNDEVGIKRAIAHCARTSYNSHTTGKPSTEEEDKKLFTRLVTSRHLSPLEHVAQAMSYRQRSGNFIGFEQYRKKVVDENNGDYEIQRPE